MLLKAFLRAAHDAPVDENVPIVADFQKLNGVFVRVVFAHFHIAACGHQNVRILIPRGSGARHQKESGVHIRAETDTYTARDRGRIRKTVPKSVSARLMIGADADIHGIRSAVFQICFKRNHQSVYQARKTLLHARLQIRRDLRRFVGRECDALVRHFIGRTGD